MSELELDFFFPITQESLNILTQSLGTLPFEQPIRIYLASSGGDVNVGIQMYNYLRRFTNLTIEAMGNIDSIAVVVFLAAKHRTSTANTSFLLHGIALDSAGPVSLRLKDVEGYSEQLTHQIKRYSDIFNERTTGASAPIDLKSALAGRSDVWLDVTAAKSAGILTT